MDSENTIVACSGTKIIGWSWAQGNSVIYGDAEWIESAKEASEAKKFVNLHAGSIGGVADLSNPKNLLGIFLAMADLPRESINLLNAPEELLELTEIELTELNHDDEIYDDFERIIERNQLTDLPV